jgi:serine/threonine protein kinase
MMDIPAQIGPYRVDREIGRGGMGVVYLARDERLDRHVAIKALPDELASDSERLARLEREARTLAQLNHPNIAGIYGIEEQEGRKFLILEYVEGETLGDRLDAGSIPVDHAIEIAIEMAKGVEAANEAGVIHRDLKPDNIKIASDGHVKILDFGIARTEESTAMSSEGPPSPALTVTSSLTRHAPTRPGAVLGTPAYMSPEQASGLRVDARTDIWSFGVILYEMLVGRNPFRRDSIDDSIGAVLREEIDLDLVPSPTPPMVLHVLRRCLERAPSRRWRSIADVRIQLEDARSDDRGGTTAGSRIVDRSFRLTDAVCKLMDRDGFDPLTLGWEMQYADNERDSSVLVMWIPSFGGDHTTLRHRHLMDACPYRMVTPTLVGMEPHAAVRPDISIENQLVALLALASELRARIGPKCLVIGGSSCGGILALRCAAGRESVRLFDGLLAIDPDLQESDCFVTGLFAELEADSEQNAVDAVRKCSASCETLEEWVSMHEYMVQCIEKMQNDITPLIKQARDLTRPYRGIRSGSESPFLAWLRDACETTGAVRCVFPDDREKHRLVGEIRLVHLDRQCLGPGFNDDMFAFVSASTHFEMLRPEHMTECIDDFVQKLLRP